MSVVNHVQPMKQLMDNLQLPSVVSNKDWINLGEFTSFMWWSLIWFYYILGNRSSEFGWLHVWESSQAPYTIQFQECYLYFELSVGCMLIRQFSRYLFGDELTEYHSANCQFKVQMAFRESMAWGVPILPTTVLENIRQSGLSPTTVPEMSTGFLLIATWQYVMINMSYAGMQTYFIQWYDKHIACLLWQKLSPVLRSAKYYNIPCALALPHKS